jgi:hypothetical protein
MPADSPGNISTDLCGAPGWLIHILLQGLLNPMAESDDVFLTEKTRRSALFAEPIFLIFVKVMLGALKATDSCFSYVNPLCIVIKIQCHGR